MFPAEADSVESKHLRKPYWRVAGMLGLPILTLTAYLLWVWPRPSGASLFAAVGPYFISLLTGLPFALRVIDRPHRTGLIVIFLALGFIVLWLYALIVLCLLRGVCL
jgi:hypothetical protein